MENTLDNGSMEGNPTRPGYLTTLCILTWVGCAIGLYQGLKGVFGAGAREQLDKLAAESDKASGAAKEMLDKMMEQMAANMEVMEKWQVPSGIVSLLGVIAC